MQNQLVFIHNPQGSLTNSDLELMALLLTAILAQTTTSKPHPNIVVASDNITAISWVCKGSTTSVKAPAYLLQLLAAACHAAPFSLTSVYTPGVSNKLADCCSRTATLLDSDFLTAINTAFPIQHSWHFQLIHQTVTTGIHASRRTANDTTLGIWEDFCIRLPVHLELINVTDPIPLLQLFALQYRTGALAPSRSPMRS